ncbi:MAG: DUF4091 domain-containing protein [Dysgonamonadaceae bacterium]|jgi:hypothetical protein|nr:DUF4091 domain-containing protein [Dysgonamonadaceae bacterium]
MKNSILFSLLLFSTLSTALSLSAQTLNGSFDNKFRRYVANTAFGGQINNTWNVEAWKGERITKQIVLWTSGQINNLSVSAAGLTGNGGVIPASAISFRYGKYAKGDMLSKECGGYPTRNGYQQIVDAWSTEPVTSLDSSDPLKLWAVIQVPQNTPKGAYTGKIKATGGSGSVELTVNLYVPDMQLPDVGQWTFHLDLWQYPAKIVEFYNANNPSGKIALWSDEHFALLEPFYRELAGCGQKAITAHIKADALGEPSMVKWIKKADGEWEYDFTAFDRYVSTLMEWGIGRQINCFSPIGWNENEIPYYDEASQSSRILTAAPGSSLYSERWNHFLTRFQSHLDAKGWFDKTVLYFDEISEEKALPVIDNVILPNNPAWKIGGTITHDFSAASKAKFHDLSGLLGRNFSTTGFDDKVFTIYTSCTQLFPNSFVTRENTTAEMTWMGWHAANMNYSGYLRWAYDNWQLNDPADARDGSNTAGDFSLVYRSSNNAPITCYPSLRLMMLREGIQDYEKIRILKKIFQASDQVKLQTLNAVLRKFTAASGEDYPESLINEGQEMLATLSHNMVMPTGIKNIRSGHGRLTIYPNPASGYIHIKIPDGQTVSSVRFFSVSGVELALPLTGNDDNSCLYSLNNISRGLYFARAATKGGTYGGIFLVR